MKCNNNAAMNRLANIWVSGKSPRVVASSSGENINSIPGPEGNTYLLRVLTSSSGVIELNELI